MTPTLTTGPGSLSEPRSSITGMAGGHHTPRQQARGLPLSQRTQPAGSPDATTDPDPDSVDPKPCWIAPGDQPTPGTVLTWQRNPDGTWTALVITRLPASRITPRQ